MSDDALFGKTITLCFDPNDGTHGLFLDGSLICDSGDDDVTPSGGMDFWRDALDVLCDNLGATLKEECRYRPSRRDGYPGEKEWESFWPQRLEDMVPVEEPNVPDPEAEIVPEPDDEDANPNWIF